MRNVRISLEDNPFVVKDGKLKFADEVLKLKAGKDTGEGGIAPESARAGFLESSR